MCVSFFFIILINSYLYELLISNPMISFIEMQIDKDKSNMMKPSNTQKHIKTREQQHILNE